MLSSKVVVIAGAGGGLGQECCRVFAAAGAKLALLGRDEAELERLAAELKLQNGRFFCFGLDVSDQIAAQEAAARIVEELGSVDVFINLIGGWAGGKSLAESPAEDFEFMAQQHIFSMISMSKAFLPPMLERGWGRVLAISSPSASQPPGMNAPYAMGKAGLEALVLSMAQEVKGRGVTANVLQVNTIDVNHQRIKNPSEKNASWATPEEISATLLHLCSEDAGMINGARIPVFGGF